MPIANVVTRIIGNPSGTIATKIAIATKNWNLASVHRSPPSTYSRIKPIETINAATINAINPRNLPNDSNLCSKGVLGVSASAISLAILPSSVFIPVAVTIPTALPVEIVVPMYSMFFLSARRVSGGSESSFTLAGIDSPVNADSSTLHCHASLTRISAGTFNPSSILTMSPGTNCEVFISNSMPSRQTIHLDIVICFSAPISCSALFSCQYPKKAFRVSTIPMKIASPGLSGWVAKASKPAPIRR